MKKMEIMKKCIIISELIIIVSAMFALVMVIVKFDIGFALLSSLALFCCCPFSLLYSGEPEKAFLPLAVISLGVLIKALLIFLI